MAFDLSEDIRLFVDEVVDSFAMWDLVICFAKKPDEAGSLEDIAQMTGRPIKELTAHLQKLVTLELVEAVKDETGGIRFTFSRKSPKAQSFQAFLEYNQFQENRLRILSHLLQRGIR